jgi:hypothetical protein
MEGSPSDGSTAAKFEKARAEISDLARRQWRPAMAEKVLRGKKGDAATPAAGKAE